MAGLAILGLSSGNHVSEIVLECFVLELCFSSSSHSIHTRRLFRRLYASVYDNSARVELNWFSGKGIFSASFF